MKEKSTSQKVQALSDSDGEPLATNLKQASSKQFIVVVFVLALATKMFLLPIYLIQMAGRDGYIALGVGVGFDLLTLVIFVIAMRLSRDTDFFTLLGNTFGKVGSKIIVAFIALFLFFKLNLAATETLTFYSDNVFADFDKVFMVVVLLIFLAAVGNHTLRALCRLNELMVPVVVVGIVVLISIVLATGFDLANILPALRAPDRFARAILHNAAWIGDFSPLALFVGRTELKKHTAGISVASGAIGSAVAVFFAIVMCAAFGNVPMLADSSTNISNILQYSLGNVYGRIDLFSSILWSIAAFVETALFFYATARCIAYVIGENYHFFISLATCVLLYVSIIFAMTDPTIFSAIVSNTVTSVLTPVFGMGLPVLILVCAIVRRRADGADGKKNKKGGKSVEV